MKLLESVFEELGISQYLNAFIDQGFDSWDTVLDITEADLDVLGVKLGHRRKLQRRIANSRGLASDSSLLLGKRPSVEEPRPQDVHCHQGPKLEGRENGGVVVTKRKYRRHPKPDENAPERPPSAYVLFSNKMRDDLKGRNLSFTEIAKLVGENWQSLSPAEKEPFESHAQALKDTYQANLAEYRKTPEYKKYMAYLFEFKAKHAPSSQDKEAKRIKLAESGLMSGSSANRTPNRTSRSGSSGSQRGSEPPPSRQQRFSSVGSGLDSQNPASMTPASHHNSLEDILDSPRTAKTELHPSEHSPTFSASPTEPSSIPNPREPAWMDDQRMDQTSMHRHLPSFSDVFDSPGILDRIPPPNEPNNGFPFPRTRASPGPPPGLLNGDNRPPPFRTEQSSGGGSTSSSASSFGYPRTPIEGPLPIHALLTSKPTPHAFETSQHQHPYQYPQHQPVFQPRRSSTDQTIPHGHPPAPSNGNGMGPPMMNGYHRESPSAPYPHGAAAATTGIESGYSSSAQPATPTGPLAPRSSSHERKNAPNLDGMNALLRAGEIVDRRTQ